MENHTAKVNEEKLKLEDRYSVQITDAAFDMAVQGLKTFDSKLIFDDASPKKTMEILDAACKLVFERFRNCAYETSFYEEAHQLRWDLVELIEIFRDTPNTNTRKWVIRLRWERDCESVFMNEFLCRWEHVVVSPGGCHFLNQEFLQQLSLFKEINNNINDNNDNDDASLKSCLDDVAQFINVIRSKLVRSFDHLLTVTSSHVAEVASKMSDIPLTQFLLPHNDNKKLKAKYMTNLRVLEQQHVVHDIYETLASSTRLSTSSSTHPRGSFLLLGQLGAGKTEIAKAVAKHWYCDVIRLVEIDVSDLADESVFWRRLSEVVEKRPYSVIVLEKIDKASESVTRALVDVLSKEVPRPSGDVDLSNSIIFMTSDVGSDQLRLVCKCHRKDEETHKLFLLNPVKFLKTHDCTLKGSGPERALIQARKVLSGDVLDSVDKVLFVNQRFVNDKDVCRVLLREIVREIYGQRLVVHVSDRALDFLVSKIRTQVCEEAGKVLKKMLLEQVIQWLPARQNLNNAVVYVDKHDGTTKVSFSFHSHEQSVDDWYFKLKDGTFDRLMANLRAKVESSCRIFELRSEYVGLLESNDIGSSKALADNIFDEMLKWSPFQETPSDIDITESCLPSSWERELKDWQNNVKELNRRLWDEGQQVPVKIASTNGVEKNKNRTRRTDGKSAGKEQNNNDQHPEKERTLSREPVLEKMSLVDEPMMQSSILCQKNREILRREIISLEKLRVEIHMIPPLKHRIEKRTSQT